MTLRSAIPLLGLCLLAACHRGSADADDAQLTGDGAEAMSSCGQSTHLAGLVFGAVSAADPAKAAAQVGGQPAELWPDGCVTRSRDATDPRTAHVTFHGCSGPFGMLDLRGSETVVFTGQSGGTLEAQITGDDLTANGRPITFSATGEIGIEGAVRHVIWQGSWSHRNAAGATVEHVSELTVDVDVAGGCRTVNGNAKTHVGSREVDTTISDLVTCANPDGVEACPEGKVTHTSATMQRSVTFEFDGSDRAAVSGPGGTTWDVTLVCPSREQ
jgi:hypothetical protein